MITDIPTKLGYQYIEIEYAKSVEFSLIFPLMYVFMPLNTVIVFYIFISGAKGVPKIFLIFRCDSISRFGV